MKMTAEQRRKKNEYRKLYRQEKKKRGECRDCKKPAVKAGLCDYHYERQLEATRRYAEKNAEYITLALKQLRDRNRELVFQHYGSVCNMCGSSENLSIDHINEDGKVHRECERIETGTQTYAWLVKNDFPEGFQTLCQPCNIRKYHAHRRVMREQRSIAAD